VNLVLLTSPGIAGHQKTEYDNWNLSEKLVRTINCKFFTLKGNTIYILKCPDNYYDADFWNRIHTAFSSPHVFIHFGGAKTGEEEIFKIKEVLAEYSVRIPTLSFYSLGMNNNGFPEGIGTILKDESRYPEFFDLFLPLINVVEQQSEVKSESKFQLHISALSLLMNVYQKSQVAVIELMADIKEVLMMLKEKNIAAESVSKKLDELIQNKPMPSQDEIEEMKKDCETLLKKLKGEQQ